MRSPKSNLVRNIKHIFQQIKGHISRTVKVAKLKIKLSLPFTIPDRVQKFQMICLRELLLSWNTYGWTYGYGYKYFLEFLIILLIEAVLVARLAYSKPKYSMYGLIKGSNNEFITILCLVFNKEICLSKFIIQAYWMGFFQIVWDQLLLIYICIHKYIHLIIEIFSQNVPHLSNFENIWCNSLLPCLF